MRILSAHQKPITCLAFSPDGSRLAEAANGGTVRVWDVAGATVSHTLDMSGKCPNRVKVAFSPYGGRLAVAADHVELVELESGTRVTLPAPPRLSPFRPNCRRGQRQGEGPAVRHGLKPTGFMSTAQGKEWSVTGESQRPGFP